MTRKTEARLTNIERRIGPPDAVPIALTDYERALALEQWRSTGRIRRNLATGTWTPGDDSDTDAARVCVLLDRAEERRRAAIGGGIG